MRVLQGCLVLGEEPLVPQDERVLGVPDSSRQLLVVVVS
jgi:hypothetical protein